MVNLHSMLNNLIPNLHYPWEKCEKNRKTGVYTKPGLGHGPCHGPPVAYPMAYPTAHSKFCNFTNYNEKITTYVCRDQALEIRAMAAIFFSGKISLRAWRFKQLLKQFERESAALSPRLLAASPLS